MREFPRFNRRAVAAGLGAIAVSPLLGLPALAASAAPLRQPAAPRPARPALALLDLDGLMGITREPLLEMTEVFAAYNVVLYVIASQPRAKLRHWAARSIGVPPHQVISAGRDKIATLYRVLGRRPAVVITGVNADLNLLAWASGDAVPPLRIVADDDGNFVGSFA